MSKLTNLTPTQTDSVREWLAKGLDLKTACNVVGLRPDVMRGILTSLDEEGHLTAEEIFNTDAQLIATVYDAAINGSKRVEESKVVETDGTGTVMLERRTEKVIHMPPDTKLALELIRQRRPQEYNQARVEPDIEEVGAEAIEINFIESDKTLENIEQ